MNGLWRPQFKYPLLILSLIILFCGIVAVVVVFQSARDTAWKGVMTRLEALPVEPGAEVVLLDKHDTIWSGKEEFVTTTLRKIITVVDGEGPSVQGMLPVRIGVLDSRWEFLSLARARPPSFVVLHISALQRSESELEYILVHEFSHLIKPPIREGAESHHVEWRRTCEEILANLRGDLAPQTKCGRTAR